MDARTHNTRTRRSGGLAVALFVVGVVACVTFTEAALRPRDDIMSRIPLDAIAYAHGDMRTAAWAVAPDIEGLAPKEFALAVVRRDGVFASATVLRWPSWRGPSSREKEVLDALDGELVGEHLYAIGDGALVESIRNGARPSLADDDQVTAALSSLRGAFGLQGLLRSSAFPVALPATFAGGDDVAFGVARTDDGFTSVTGSAERIAAFAPLGYSMPRGGDAVAPLPVAPNAMLTVAAGPSSYDIMTSGLGHIETAGRAAGVPETEELIAARDQVRDALSDAVLTIFRTDDDTPTAGLTVRNADVPAIMTALTTYVNAAIPDTRVITLGDGSEARELVLGDGEVFVSAGSSLFRLREDIRTDHGIDLMLRVDDEGLRIGPDTVTLAALGLSRPAKKSHCPGVRGHRPTLLIHDIDRFLTGFTPLDALLRRAEVTDLVAQQLEDELISVCG